MNLSFLKVILRFVIAVFAAWCGLKLISLFVSYGTLFPVWAMALVIGAGIVLIEAFYRRERRLVSPSCGRLLVALRCFSYCVVALILMQPILQRTVTRRIERTVALLADTSDSMMFIDTEWNAGERLSLARQAKLVDDDEILLPSLETFDGLMARLSTWLASDFAEGKPPSAYKKLVADTRKSAEKLEKELADERIEQSSNLVFRTFARQLSTSVIPAVKELARKDGTFMANAALGDIRDTVPSVRAAADDLVWTSLETNRQAAITAYTDTNRFTLAAAVYTNTLGKLSDRYSVQSFDLGRFLRPMATMIPNSQPAQTSATDFTTALESVLTEIPSEQLAGVLMLTDGIHNGDAAVEPVARQLGARGVPVSSVIIGSSKPPFDLAVADISAPESVFLGDKVRVRATLSAEQARGKEAKITLLMDGEKVDETTIPISEDSFRREFSLAHAPTNNGLARYELAIENLEGERFPSNNAWKVDVSISDDRTHVLLVDDYPRWDFRYLRNLFYARDKSVHLQYVLMHPDTILGVDVTNKPPAASASRPFGEAEAGALPENADEWRKFDVIILGDIGPDVLTEDMQKNLAECVTDRGALLVTIAGPRAMPHAFPTNSPLAALLPFDYVHPADDAPETEKDFWKGPEKSYAIALTPSGRIHPVMQQSSSASENEQLWKSLPKCHWRFPILSARSGAEIIAYAEPTVEKADKHVSDATTAKNAAEQMEAERLRREHQAIILGHNVGRGKVLSLNTDESWRLRYRVGDTRHHKFWGQVIRWGLGERLRSGTAQLRVGTERMTYSPTEPVRLLARVVKSDFTPIKDAELMAAVSPAGDVAVTNTSTIALTYVEDSPGLYEAILPPLGETGAYSVKLLDPDRYSGAEPGQAIETMFFVAASRRPIEMARVAASRETADALARWTGGRVAAPHEAGELTETFGEPSRVVKEPLEIALWCRPWLFILLAVSLIAEWALRKMKGLV